MGIRQLVLLLCLGIGGLGMLGCEDRGPTDDEGRREIYDENRTEVGAESGARGTAGMNESDLSEQDRAFVHKAALGGMTEVRLGRLAQERAGSQEVKQFGQRMVQDHTKANQELQAVAMAKGLEVPKELDAEHQQTVTRLSDLSGKEFDHQYMDTMVKDHEKTVALFEDEAASGSGELERFAETTLPTLREHLQEAKRIASEVGIQTTQE